MSNIKKDSKNLESVLIHSLVLSTALVEKFEIMEQNNLVAQRAKQSIKNSIKFLENYVNNVFNTSDDSEETKRGMKAGSTHIAELQLRVEKSLSTSNLLNISDRKKILLQLVDETVLFPNQKIQLYEKIRDSGIIDY